MTPEQMKALQAIANAVTETVKAMGPLGAPAGPMYAAMMASGCSLDQFEQIMAALVRAGKLRKQGNLYFVAEGGRA
jgi:hypothetical protein